MNAPQPDAPQPDAPQRGFPREEFARRLEAAQRAMHAARLTRCF